MQLALEFMDAVGRAFEGKRVFVTGHTGFKGSWLCEWLLLMGADVTGYSLPPPTNPSLFVQLELAGRLQHEINDIRESGALESAIERCQPDYIFHLAAQSLVRRSYEQPMETFNVNVLGTVNLLEALKKVTRSCAVIIVTSDKCYRNQETGTAFTETDALGGNDPYSASKAAAEIATASWRDSFYAAEKILAGIAPPVGIATVRAGNVIGGGDYAEDRLVPDCFRALEQGQPVVLRNPQSVRPWQHVIEPLSGYLLLAARIYQALQSRSPELATLCAAFNFGPQPIDHRSVSDLASEMFQHWPGQWVHGSQVNAGNESHRLHLSIDRSRERLGWRPRWNFADAVTLTVQWHRRVESASAKTREQLRAYGA